MLYTENYLPVTLPRNIQAQDPQQMANLSEDLLKRSMSSVVEEMELTITAQIQTGFLKMINREGSK